MDAKPAAGNEAGGAAARPPRLLRESGMVVNKSPGKVTVRLLRTSRCQGCNACVLAGGGAYMLSEARDALGTSVGDHVVIEGTSPAQVGAGFVVYIAPLILFPIGFVAGSRLSSSLGRSGSEGTGVTAGVFLIAVYFVALALRYRRAAARGRGVMRVVEITRRVQKVEADTRTLFEGGDTNG